MDENGGLAIKPELMAFTVESRGRTYQDLDHKPSSPCYKASDKGYRFKGSKANKWNFVKGKGFSSPNCKTAHSKGLNIGTKPSTTEKGLWSRVDRGLSKIFPHKL